MSLSRYVMSSVRVPSVDHVCRLLGAQLVSGGVFSEAVVWVLDPKRRLSFETVGKAEFTLWLHALFLKMVFPAAPKQEVIYQSSQIEQIPATVDTFFELLTWLVAPDGMAVPLHWAGEAVAPLLDGHLVSSARAPVLTPEPAKSSPLTRKAAAPPAMRHPISPFVSEIRRGWSSWASALALPVPTAIATQLDGTIELSVQLPKADLTALRDRSDTDQAMCLLHHRKMACLVLTHSSQDVMRTVVDMSSKCFGMASMFNPPPLVDHVIQFVKTASGGVVQLASFEWSFDTGELRVQLSAERWRQWQAEMPFAVCMMYRPDFRHAGLIHTPQVLAIRDAKEVSPGHFAVPTAP